MKIIDLRTFRASRRLKKIWALYSSITKPLRLRKELRSWEKVGRPVPPPQLYKQWVVKEYARLFSIKTLVETGTYLGDMVEATRKIFDKIYSIELDTDLYRKARRRFSRFGHITIVQGDSGKVLPEILEWVNSPCLFWLDAHYSEGITAKGDLETPIMQEMQSILNHRVKGHVILIDDARCFVGRNDYPKVEALEKFVLEKDPNLVFKNWNDIIRIHQ